MMLDMVLEEGCHRGSAALPATARAHARLGSAGRCRAVVPVALQHCLSCPADPPCTTAHVYRLTIIMSGQICCRNPPDPALAAIVHLHMCSQPQLLCHYQLHLSASHGCITFQVLVSILQPAAEGHKIVQHLHDEKFLIKIALTAP
jgi:hypothetical protein